MKNTNQIQAFIDSKKIVAEKNWQQEKIDRVNLQRKQLSTANNNLLLVLLDLSGKLNAIKDNRERQKERWRILRESPLADPDPWQSSVAELLPAMFGEVAPYVAKAWHKVTEGLYQRGYARRSFRLPNDKQRYFQSQVTWLVNLWNSYQYQFTLVEYAQYGNHVGDYSFPYIYAAAIDGGHPTLLQEMLNILQGNAEVGTVSRNIIKGLLLSDKEEAWRAVKDLLLAAQRQEGLRQTILEALDETSIGALKYLLQVVLEEDLLRFSAVVRALDVWTGMSWESERKSAIKTALNFGLQYLNAPETISQGVRSKNNVEVHMALWAQGVYNVEECYPLLTNLVKEGNQEKRNVAFYFALQTSMYHLNTKLIQSMATPETLWDKYWLIRLAEFKDFKEAHATYTALYEELPEKEIALPNKGFEWVVGSISKHAVEKPWTFSAKRKEENLRSILPYVQDFQLYNREDFAREVFHKFLVYRYQKVNKDLKPTPFQKEMALRFIEDRSSLIQNAAATVLKRAAITPEEVPVLEGILRKKSANLRKGVLAILIKQQDHAVLQSIGRLSVSKQKNQRLAALDLLKQLHQKDRVLDQVAQYAAAYKEKNKTGADENLVLDELLQQKLDYTAKNGWGLYDPAKLLPVKLPEINAAHYFHKRIFPGQKGLFKSKKSNGGFSKPLAEVQESIAQLDALIAKHKDTAFEAETYAGGTETYLVGNRLLHPKLKKQKEDGTQYTAQEWYQLFPLAKVWEQWFKDAKLDALDLVYLNARRDYYHLDQEKNPAWLLEIAGRYKQSINLRQDYYNTSDFNYHQQIGHILGQLAQIHPFTDTSYFLEGAVSLCNEMNKRELHQQIVSTKGYGNYLFSNFTFYSFYKEKISLSTLSTEDLMRFYNLELWLNNKVYKSHKGNLRNICEYTERLQLPEGDIYYYLLDAGVLQQATNRRRKLKNQYNWEEEAPKMVAGGYIPTIINRVLEIEFSRGESDTDVSYLANQIGEIKGIHYLVTCLQALGNEKLETGYGYGTMSKKSMMSRLLGVCYPLETETQADFNAAMDAAKFSEKRLVEVAMYVPQWQKFIQHYIGWKGLEAAIWWLHAHSSNYMNATKETEIARYSAIPITDFNNGAVDVDWFKEVYHTLGKARWKIVYDAAKYIAHGNGHTLAKLYADVILKEVKITEVSKRVKDKRNQNYLRVYGLVPLSKTVAKKDVLKRYNFLQQFLKESKQFGAQRQASEKLAVSIAMDNLARNAGYPDPIRLTWSMESLQAQQLLANAKELVFDEVKIWLAVNDMGKANLLVTKNDKPLKAIPAKLRKDKKVLELKDFQKQLSDQYKRTKKSLEQAMVNQDDFTVAEIRGLAQHPVVSPMLQKLVLRTQNGFMGIWQEDALHNVTGNTQKPAADEPLFIAHCTHLYHAQQWAAWQKHFFTQAIKQPFKQVYRELYLPTPDEEKAGSISKRYDGHQVQPKKTVALLKGRGWTVDYDTGLQRVWHKENIIAELYAMADWFSPADVEHPTLETIRFYSKKDHKTLSFDTIPSHLFSEVMRDVDLVVSVAHAGGVDPEASLSTIALRKVIAEESAKLFKLNNISFKERHVLIQGHHGNYSLHLGSGVVHVQPGGYVSIVPVHAQHRGRIFLPFVDEDPKTAEIVSKMLLLAEDKKLQDPTILRQILGR